MRKISIITPVFNEEKNLDRYFIAISKLNCNLASLEIVFINDGSKDKSLKVLENFKKKSKFKISIINFTKNRGRAVARAEGAKKASFDNLLFLDCKCEVFQNALEEIKNFKEQPIIGNPIQKRINLFDKFFYILRKELYKDSFGENFPDIYITEKNFNSIGKGTGIFYCNRKLFLSSLPNNIEDPECSDDTKLLSNIVKKHKILKTSKVKAYYNTRENFTENMRHIFERGPRFVDYYFPKKGYYYKAYFFSLVSLYLLIVFGINYPFYALALAFLSFTAISFYFAKSLKKVILFAPMFALFSIAFGAGIFKARIKDLLILIGGVIFYVFMVK